ncbi:MAG: hypothetical protein LBC76_08220 [Treponema sp.]|jgi:hypothetical protein|nr:hypothetical protein [Treponema sp.]
MANNVETKMWLVETDRCPLSDKEVESFFSQFITVDHEQRIGEDPRQFDFNTIIPQPENLWNGDVGGIAEDNLKTIEEYGGLEAVKQAYKDCKCFPFDKTPCLTKEQIKKFGMVSWWDWNIEHWQTKWNAYYCQYDWAARYGGAGYAHVAFYTAWNVPEEIIRRIRNIALESGYEIYCEFSGEIDEPGLYRDGSFMYFYGKLNEETEELERVGDPIDVHC